MDEKTESLRDIFIDVADQETVTERQEESPGTLTEQASRERQVHAVIEEMRDRYGFDTEFSTEELGRVASGYLEDRSDAEIASELGTDEDAVREARLILHLVDEDDRDLPVDVGAVRAAVDEGASLAELAEEFDATSETLEEARQVIVAEREMRRSNYRYRDEFRALLGDHDLSEQLTEAAKEDGLEDATEGVETNTSF